MRAPDHEDNDLICFEDADLGYGTTAVLREVSTAVIRGQFIGLIGPNGAGKSTLLKTMLRLQPPVRGHVHFHRRLLIGYVPQRHALDPIYPIRVRDVAVMGLYPEIGWLRRPGAAHYERTMRALDACGVAHLEGRLFRELSGGQQQRTLLARALVAEPELIILDEPTNDLDIAGERGIMDLVEQLNRKSGRTVVLVSHNLNAIVNHATHIWTIKKGRLTSGTVAELCTKGTIGELFDCPVSVIDCEGGTSIMPVTYKRDD
jgi:ABC-type Mn2+/Zn2+ transport system ATPase subunit